MGPTCTTPVAAVWAKAGKAEVAFRDWALNTFHCAVVLLASPAVVPHQATFTRPGPPAVIHAPMAVLVSGPLLTRTGVVHVPPALVDEVMKMLIPSAKVT